MYRYIGKWEAAEVIHDCCKLSGCSDFVTVALEGLKLLSSSYNFTNIKNKYELRIVDDSVKMPPNELFTAATILNCDAEEKSLLADCVARMQKIDPLANEAVVLWYAFKLIKDSYIN